MDKPFAQSFLQIYRQAAIFTGTFATIPAYFCEAVLTNLSEVVYLVEYPRPTTQGQLGTELAEVTSLLK
jgi:hypothetical protein